VKLNEVDLAQNYKNIYRKNNILQAETYVPNLKNKEHYLVGTATALYDSDGNYAGAIEIIHDITQRQYYIKEIEQQRQNIIESIQYALHIQEALLPDLSVLKNVFAGYFLCFKPRDIVSGDFYWTYQHKNKTVLLAADCTGHGVPGAMMSMLGISFLNQIVHHMEQLHTNIILDKLRRMIITYLSKEDLNIQRKDGMDMSLVIFDKETMQMEFSGANISLFVTSANIPVIIEGREFKQTLKKDELPVKLFEVHGDKMPVGSFIKTNPFSRHTLQLIKGDRFYLFSDGFSDLWNHQSVKKFTIGRFKDLILSSSQLSIDKQYDAIETQYHQWLGNSKQVDDIVIIGVEV
jgi:serine phosphatase RsbU (regulator of sigma subunit)